MTVWLVGEATMRFFQPPQVKGGIMLIVAVMGLIFNLIQMKILHSGDGHYHLGGEHDHGPGEECGGHDHGHSHGHGHAHDHSHSHSHGHAAIHDGEVKKNLLANEEGHQAELNHSHSAHSHGSHEHAAAHSHNHSHNHDHAHDHAHDHGPKNGGDVLIDAAFLHVLGDMLMSVGVIIAALIIYFFPSMWMADPICTYLFSVIVMVTTIPIVKNCMQILMEGSPKSFDIEELRQDLWEISKEDIVDVHDLHVWTISMGKLSMTVHIVSLKPLKTLAAVTDLLRRKYKLHHTTIQVEGVSDKEQNPHAFRCENDIHM